MTFETPKIEINWKIPTEMTLGPSFILVPEFCQAYILLPNPYFSYEDLEHSAE